MFDITLVESAAVVALAVIAAVAAWLAVASAHDARERHLHRMVLRNLDMPGPVRAMVWDAWSAEQAELARARRLSWFARAVRVFTVPAEYRTGRVLTRERDRDV